MEILDALALVQSDEVRHSELSQALAEGFGGYDPKPPERSGFSTQSTSQGPDDPPEFWVLSMGCLSETMSLELMRLRLRHTTHPVVRSVLAGIAKDEAIHANLGWAIAEALFPRMDAATRESLGDYAVDVLDVLSRTFVTHAMPPEERRSARRMRTLVAKAGLGAAPHDEEDALFEDVQKRIIEPRLLRLGIPI